MTTYRPMHTFAVGDPATAGERVEVACDLSLDEGALIRCTFPPSPLSSGTEYFANVTPYQAEILRDLLQRHIDAKQATDPEGVSEISSFVEILRRIDDARIYGEQGTDPEARCILEGLEAHEPGSLFNDIPEGLQVTVTSGWTWASEVTLRGTRRAIVEFTRLHWGDDFSGNEAFPTWLEMIREEVPAEILQRLEELRAALRAESISYGELAELAELAPHIDRSDVELLEAAGVPEFPNDSAADDSGEEV